MAAGLRHGGNELIKLLMGESASEHCSSTIAGSSP
jgi:hypothetical protein